MKQNCDGGDGQTCFGWKDLMGRRQTDRKVLGQNCDGRKFETYERTKSFCLFKLDAHIHAISVGLNIVDKHELFL